MQMHVTKSMVKEAVNLKESKEECMGEFERRKGKGNTVIIISKII